MDNHPSEPSTEQLNDPEGRQLVAAIHARKAGKTTTTELPGPAWPPPLASRAVRRHCTRQVKAGYCADCGTKVTK